MTAVYVLLAICMVVGIAAVAIGVLLLKRGGGGGVDRNTIENENNILKKDILNSVENIVRLNNSGIMGSINAQSEKVNSLDARIDRQMNNFNEQIERFKESVAKSNIQQRDELSRSVAEMRNSIVTSLNDMKTSNAQSLKEVRDDNAKQLEKIREEVSGKLESTLDKRVGESFKAVNDRLEEIHRMFGELRSLQSGVGDLNKVLNNIKTRGTWGEVSLECLLEDILRPEQYEKQYKYPRSGDAVDFAIKMPGKSGNEVILPIDAKFPVEDYLRLVDASNAGDKEGIERASKELEKRVKHEAMSIRDKYIKQPLTTDFAIMYLPTEGLYAEIIKRNGLIEFLQKEYRIVVCGPTTIAALLNSLRMGFTSVAVEKRSTDIIKLFVAFGKDFEKFCELLQKTGEKLGSVQKTIDEAQERTRQIRKKLDKVNSYAIESEEEVPELPSSIAED